MEYVVGLGEAVISAAPEDVIRTFALASCVGLTVYCPTRSVFAMAHIVLPDSSFFEAEKVKQEMRFADTAVKALFEKLSYSYGCISMAEMKVRIFGGATGDSGDVFRIGERNLFAVRKELKKLGLAYDERETGGRISRTLVAYTGKGEIEIIRRPLIALKNRDNRICLD